MTDHFKSYESIENVVAFDERGVGPYIGPLSVTANCSSNRNYPECRIAVHISTLASGGLTVEQSAKLRAILERAERDVQAGMDGRIEPDPPEVIESSPGAAGGVEVARG